MIMLCARKSDLREHRLASLPRPNRNTQGRGLCWQKPNFHRATAVTLNWVLDLTRILRYCYHFRLHFPEYFLSFFRECILRWKRTLRLIYLKESRIMWVKNWTCVIQSHSAISAFNHLQTWNRSIATITFTANRVPRLWQSLFFHVTDAFCTYNTASPTDHGSQITDCSALDRFAVKLSTWFLCSQHFLCQLWVVKKPATGLQLKYHGWKLVRFVAHKSDRVGAYLTIYVICG